MSELTLEDRAHALENDYFRRQEQELIEKMRAKLAAENNKVSEMSCPKGDGGKLVAVDYETVKLNVCDVCHGVWLDAGELAQILHKDEGQGWFGRLFS